MPTELRTLLLSAFENFISEHYFLFDQETVYGLAFYYPAEASSICCTIGTIQGMKKTADEYYKLGYRNKNTGDHAEIFDWLKWSSPEEWTGLESNAFEKFNKALLEKIKNFEVEEYSDFLPNLIIESGKQLEEMMPVKNIPKVFSYGSFDLELSDLTRKLNAFEVYEKWEIEMNRSLKLNDVILSENELKRMNSKPKE
jgi:hypothetical protein